MSGFSTILGGGGSGIATVNFSIQASATGTIPALYIANSITDTAGFIVAIQNTNVSAITLSVSGGSIVNAASYAAITSSNSVTVQAGQTVVLETDVANLNYYIVAYSQAVEFTGGAANQLLYQVSPNNTGYVAAGTNNQVLTSVSGVPTWATSAPLALDLTGGSTGQLVYQAGANNTTFLPAGTINQVLIFDGTNPAWSGTAPEAANLSGGVSGSVVYQTNSGITGYTAAGTTGQVLISGGTGSPTWTSTPTFGGETITQGGSTGTPLQINSSNTRGGAGFAEILAMTNTTGGATNPNKFLRMNTTGSLQIINSAYTATLLDLNDAGVLSAISGISLSGTNASDTAPTTSIKMVGNSGLQNVVFMDSAFNNVFGDPTKTGNDTYIESGRSIFLCPNGNIQSNKAQSVQINTGGQITTPATIGNSFAAFKSIPPSTVQSTATASLDNLNARFVSGGGSALIPQLSAVSGSYSAYTSGMGSFSSGAVRFNNTSATTYSAGTWTNIPNCPSPSSGADFIQIMVTDNTNDRVYRVTYNHGTGVSSGSVSVERIA